MYGKMYAVYDKCLWQEFENILQVIGLLTVLSDNFFLCSVQTFENWHLALQLLLDCANPERL